MPDETVPHTSIVARLQHKIDEVLKPLLDDRPFALVDFPDHSNVGDSAIWLGETAFFAKHGLSPNYCSNLKTHVSNEMKNAIGDGTIFLHGGGNFGTIWKAHQDFRIDLLQRFPGQRIVQLPQSIHFDSPDNVHETAKAIERHGNFVLLMRDQPSLEFAQRHFWCETSLCPDMAFYLGALKRKPPTLDLFYLLRTDLEKSISGLPEHHAHSFKVDDWLEDDRLAIKTTTALSRLWDFGSPRDKARLATYGRLAKLRLQRGIDLLSSGRVVVTDRLHGHIMSTLLGISHVALDNNYGKLGNFIDAWTRDVGNLRTAKSLEEAAEQVETLL
jgi:exopolysaccharide biosynthesis predicted pyruvyltransferase EpsI